jgi:hypothetical protein
MALQSKITGSLNKNDSKTYHPFTFEVPSGTTNIQPAFEYSPHYAPGRIHPNQLKVSIDGPNVLRGHRNLQRSGSTVSRWAKRSKSGSATCSSELASAAKLN